MKFILKAAVQSAAFFVFVPIFEPIQCSQDIKALIANGN